MRLKNSLLLMGLLAGLLGSGYAMADHRGHTSIGVYVGPGYGPYYPRPHPYWAPGPYYYPYPYYPYPYPPVVVVPPPASPPVYVEQAPQQPSPPAPQASAEQGNTDGYWYHCNQPEGYYPYVKECPAGWQRETPKPPSQGQ